MRRFLLLDTVRQPPMVAIATGTRVLTSAEIADRFKLSERLLAEIDRLSDRTETPLGKLAAIGVVTGPGPFTALRIAAAVANALGYARRIPLVGVRPADAEPLEAFAAEVAGRVKTGRTQQAILPDYGREPSITPPSAGGRRTP